MHAKSNHIVRLTSGVALLAVVLAGAAPAGSESAGTTSLPKVFVHLKTAPGHRCQEHASPSGTNRWASGSSPRSADGPDSIFPGDGVADGTVEFDVTPLPGNYAVYAVTMPEGYSHPARGRFTMGTTDVHVVMTVPGDETAGPSLSLPEAMVVNATSPSGTAVAYQATATDSQGSAVAVSCSPPSGSTFAIGSTVVSCTATDGGGRTTHGDCRITVRGASDQLAALIEKVRGVGPGRSLEAKLRTARQTLRKGDVAAACSALRDFLRDVETHTGKSISLSQAEEFITDGMRIAAVTGCP